MATAKQTMFDKFQPWVLTTYGDSAKTKTITRKKAQRIAALLKSNEKELGAEPAGSEGAKFRLWVKSKGLQLAPPDRRDIESKDGDKPDKVERVATPEPGDETALYLPTGTDKSLDGKVHFVFKKVAVVEKFFDIIYSVHVESSGETQLRGRAGKHCGQKRTYRAIADQYAFIPREAISRFLLYCTECQRKQPPTQGISAKKPRLNTDQQLNIEVESLQAAPPPLYFDPKTPFLNQINHPATPPATPPIDPGSPQKIFPDGPESTICQDEGARCDGLHTKYLSPGIPNDLTTCGQDQRRQNKVPGDATHSDHYTNQAAAAAQAIAYAQALQSFKTPALPFPIYHHSPVKILPITAENLQRLENSSDIDLSLPITSTYLRRMRRQGMPCEDGGPHGLGQDPEELPTISIGRDCEDLNMHEENHEQSIGHTPWSSFPPLGQQTLHKGPGIQVSQLGQLLGQNGNGTMSPGRSDMSREDSIIADDSSSIGNKEDDDDDDEDGGDDDKFEGFTGDPERLKAFNMFVRLFVDENLDRHVPISKQPKEKIQAIIDSCTRQFPEYTERPRKRIRTYLKSCRRTKRSREQAGLDTNNRPTPPHLTSVLAEQLLARACENEAENAKRMRMGMEPISQSMPTSLITSSTVDTLAGSTQPGYTSSFDKSKMDYKSEQLVNLLAASQQQPPQTLAQVTMSPANGISSSMHRQQFQPNAQGFGNSPVGLLPGAGVAATNGQNQLDAMKKPPLLNHKLNGTEMTAVRQLITGYRESAAFLLRSADELENLLQIQPKL